MKTLYLDCGMGAAGDMLTAALLELLPDPGKMIERLNGLGIPGVEYRMEAAEKCGITGTSVRVLVNGEEEAHDHHHHHHHDEDGHEHHHDHDHHHHHHDEDGHEHHHDHDHDHDHHHHHDHNHDHDHDHDHDHHHDDHHHHHHVHRSLGEIRELVDQLPIDTAVREDVMAVYRSIAQAEGHVHGKPVEEIHFHEVGTWDAVADVTAVALILSELAPEEIVVSPVHVGSGQVHCAHGILPVPAPATAYILRDIPVYGGSISGELCTPTGAALLRHFATRFGSMPALKPSAVGYGMGKKDFPAANCVRAILGESVDISEKDDAGKAVEGDREERNTILALSCNVDDMTGEEIGYAMDRLFEAGAVEVFTTPVGMKKSRPGIMITMICSRNNKDRVLQALFRHTTTLGVREEVMNRYTLERRIETVDTPYGPVRRKVSFGYGVERSKWEYDDLVRIAGEEGLSISELRSRLDRLTGSRS